MQKDHRQTDKSPLPTEEEIDERAEGWRPYRSLAAAYLFASAYEA
jgi:3-methyladenine DNA glycosylase/8-oxoguanine DNA glycosylase